VLNRDVFRQLALSKGVKMILDFKETGWTTQKRTECVYLLMPLLYAIDLVDRLNGECDGLTTTQMNYLRASPREVVKFFHRRSACSCLKGFYYNLKDNTPKMILCQYCWKTRHEGYLRMRNASARKQFTALVNVLNRIGRSIRGHVSLTLGSRSREIRRAIISKDYATCNLRDESN
jgi:hypothetical protein